MTRTDQKLISEAYNSIGLGGGQGQGCWPDDPNGKQFNEILYSKIVKIAEASIGNTFQEFVDELSKTLDIPYQNLDRSLQDTLESLHQRLNPTKF